MPDLNLPRPEDQLAGCVWLPRIVAKARQLRAGALPEAYVARFGHPTGVDGQFLHFFGLTKEEIVEASAGSDDDVSRWFLSSPARASRVAEWNHVAVNLGRAGFPMAERLPIALSTTYKHLADRKFETVFAVLNADESA